jgi:dTDP-4-amino-4,6-dideoxygalactose transaminase
MPVEYENLKMANAPFHNAYLDAANRVINSGWYVLGNEVAAFEKAFAAYNKSAYCVGLASGLDALYLGLKCFDFEPNSEVIVPSNTYIATIIAIVNAGFKPILVEPQIGTYNIDETKIEAAITSATVAIMPVHLYGKACNMEVIAKLAYQYKLKIIEDCAQAHGAMHKGITVGNVGDIGAFSFYPTKNLGCLGDGGGITCNDAQLAHKMKMLRNYGSTQKYYNEVAGINSRLDELQAAFLNIKLEHLNQINEHKRSLAQVYFTLLKSDFILPVVDTEYYDVYHIFNIRHSRRDELKQYLLKSGIKTEIHYPLSPVHQQAMQHVLNDFKTPIADEIHATTLSLPISYAHTINDIEQVCNALNKF